MTQQQFKALILDDLILINDEDKIVELKTFACEIINASSNKSLSQDDKNYCNAVFEVMDELSYKLKIKGD